MCQCLVYYKGAAKMTLKCAKQIRSENEINKRNIELTNDFHFIFACKCYKASWRPCENFTRKYAIHLSCYIEDYQSGSLKRTPVDSVFVSKIIQYLSLSCSQNSSEQGAIEFKPNNKKGQI